MMMAEAQTNPLPYGGYDDEFVDNVEDDLLCPICTLPLKEVVQTRRCGHRLCRSCIDAYFARQETDGQQITCPVCRTNLNTEQDIFEDLAADRKILSYTIKCPRRSRGCQWTDELRAKDDHLAYCLHEIVSCTNKNCNVKLERKGLQDHVATKCDWRIIRCKFCPVAQPALHMEAHQKVCPKLPVTCPQKCGMTILREKVADHKENECALVEISCPYSKLGCQKKFQRKEKTSHLQSCMQVHLDLACVKLNDTEKELRTAKEKLGQRMSALEKRARPYYNVYTWKIGGFEEILKQAKTGSKGLIKSDPFYLGECGYKFEMLLYPNGEGKGENTHLSLFLSNMEGEYDAILQWPCAKDITLVLIDQQGNQNDRQKISFALGRVWKSRPVKGKEFNWGFPEFVSHDELQRGAYIVDDTIFIQAKF
ncbi:PREDICTED: TNF receptor-associated factor 4-like isoform X3 [Acropora digitifera]|uniref:TNF receptor-associated factor 4-like isoform X3 n=1 Tax=Acropora digitifera TaxID=70779 RepID=UPI00077A392A|nr:PREDICTED: TNF receptor-associated factor 4-like isoform X3 [Acropora digitifera]